MIASPIAKRMIDLNGHKFELYSAGDENSKRIIIFLHGFPQSAHAWRFQMESLGKESILCWALNQRGYANSYSPAETKMYDLDLLVEDVISLINSVSYDQVVLVGHDWGAVVAWQLAQNRPDLIDQLVILNGPHPAMMARELRRWRQLRRSWYIFAFALPWLPEWYLSRNSAQSIINIIKRAARNRCHFGIDDFDHYRTNALRAGGLTAMLNWYRAQLKRVVSAKKLQRLEKIKVPTLIIWGEKDVALGIHTVVGTERYVENLTTRYIPEIGHFPAEEDPESVTDLILAFINNKPIPGNDEPSLLKE